jgi:hypothetical protein
MLRSWMMIKNRSKILSSGAGLVAGDRLTNSVHALAPSTLVWYSAEEIRVEQDCNFLKE